MPRSGQIRIAAGATHGMAANRDSRVAAAREVDVPPLRGKLLFHDACRGLHSRLFTFQRSALCFDSPIPSRQIHLSYANPQSSSSVFHPCQSVATPSDRSADSMSKTTWRSSSSLKTYPPISFSGFQFTRMAGVFGNYFPDEDIAQILSPAIGTDRERGLAFRVRQPDASRRAAIDHHRHAHAFL